MAEAWSPALWAKAEAPTVRAARREQRWYVGIIVEHPLVVVYHFRAIVGNTLIIEKERREPKGSLEKAVSG